MSSKVEQQARLRLVNGSFDRIAKLDFVQNKWILFDVWIDLLRKYNENNEEISSLGNASIKRLLRKSERFSENNHSPSGYYYRFRKKRKMVEGISQSKSIQAILVAGKGCELQYPTLHGTLTSSLSYLPPGLLLCSQTYPVLPYPMLVTPYPMLVAPYPMPPYPILLIAPYPLPLSLYPMLILL